MPKLYIVATPIGNLSDITFRAVEVLKESDFLIVEDKRRTSILLNHYGVGKKEMVAIAERSPSSKIERIVERIKGSKVAALLSDAGTPVVSDPGRAVVQRCWEEGIEIDVVPGPSAVISALSASGFPASKFIFLGFLPKGRRRRRLLKDVKGNFTVVFFESPYRFSDTLREILDIWGDAEIFVAREMTKIHQELFRGKVSEAVEHFKGEVKGEITVVLRKGENA